jgi:tellurite resistance protein TerC
MPEERILWIVFGVAVPVMLVLDLGVFHRRVREIGFREALVWSFVWITLALIFGLLIYLMMGRENAVRYITAYLVEKTLSIDNLFVFLLIFSYFAVPEKYQHKVLFWGIVGALVMRGIFIAFGLAILETFEWVIYLFGVFLIYTGVRLSLQKEMKFRPESNPAFRLFCRLAPLSNDFHEGVFFARINGRRLATLLLLVLVVVETTDVVFAVDSIPAVLAISTDPFIVYTSNIFAILGLRSLYFVLANAARRLVYLRYGLSIILGFLGLKMLFSGVLEVPGLLSLALVVGVLAIVTFTSLRWPGNSRTDDPTKGLS